MATYVEAYKGYVADVPRVWFKRCDKRVFYFDEITQSSQTPNTQMIDINAGWSLYPVSQIPGQSTLECSMTSGQFNADMFAMANKANFAADSTFQTYGTEHPAYELDGTDGKLTLRRTPVAGTISIAGLTEGTDFSVSDKEITITGGIDDFEEGDEVEVSYEYIDSTAHVIKIDNKESAIGEAVFKFPVYNSGSDCTESSIKGYVIFKLYRVRVSQMPGFDTSYKTAATNAVSWVTLDPKRDDGMVYEMAYVDSTNEL